MAETNYLGEEPEQMSKEEATTWELALAFALQTHLCYSYIQPDDLAFRVFMDRLAMTPWWDNYGSKSEDFNAD